MYKFPLYAVLKNEKIREELIEKELNDCYLLLFNTKNKLDKISFKRSSYIRLLELKQESGSDASLLILYSDYIDQLSLELERIEKRVRQLEAEKEDKRQELLHVVKKRNILEKLEEKGKKAHESCLLRNEQKLQDEAAMRGSTGMRQSAPKL
ncbi:conserved hypothetical protein [uncultured Desulfatiglans sp.]|nr:conserved hypothetical protein [uncultured Desulfatiglans sp.]